MLPIISKVVYENQKALDEIMKANPEYKVSQKRRIDKSSLYAILKYRIPEGWMNITKAADHFATTVPKLKKILKEEGVMGEDDLPTSESYDDDYVLALRAEKTKYCDEPRTLFFWDTEKLKRHVREPDLVDRLSLFSNFVQFGDRFHDVLQTFCDKLGYDRISASRMLGQVGDIIDDIGTNESMEMFELGYSDTDFACVGRTKDKKKMREFYEKTMAPSLEEMKKLVEKYIPEDVATYNELYRRFEIYGLKHQRPWLVGPLDKGVKYD